MHRVMDDAACSVEIALSWAVAARNSLQNFSGFSPNQLVFGKNPVFPSVMNATPPALEERTNSEVVSQNLNAMNTARKDFIRVESDEKIRRALLRQVKDEDPQMFVIGDSVFYKRNASDQWRGPARVIGRDGKQILVRHGGFVVRVHACRAEHQRGQGGQGCQLDDETTTAVDVMKETPTYDEDEALSTPPSQSSRQETADTSMEILREADSGSDRTRNVPSGERTRAIDTSRMKPGQRLRFKTLDGVQVDGQIINRAGKVGGKHQSCYNVKKSCGQVSWFDLKNVEDLVEISENIEVLVAAANNESYDAKLKEVESWNENKVYEEVEDKGQSTISLRWVVTEKIKDGKNVTKARLVARGYEEDLLDSTDSPTCSKDSLRLALSLISSHGWTCKSVDVRCAFLQGKEINREVLVRPPPEFDNGKLWRLKKSVYGLNDAAKSWYESLKAILTENGMTVSSLDLALFYYQDDDKFSGVMCIHVDDVLFAGDEKFFNRVVTPIMKSLKVGGISEKTFKYIGVNID